MRSIELRRGQPHAARVRHEDRRERPRQAIARALLKNAISRRNETKVSRISSSITWRSPMAPATTSPGWWRKAGSPSSGGALPRRCSRAQGDDVVAGQVLAFTFQGACIPMEGQVTACYPCSSRVTLGRRAWGKTCSSTCARLAARFWERPEPGWAAPCRGGVLGRVFLRRRRLMDGAAGASAACAWAASERTYVETR